MQTHHAVWDEFVDIDGVYRHKMDKKNSTIITMQCSERETDRQNEVAINNQQLQDINVCLSVL